MKFTVRPGVRNIKSQSIARTQKAFLKRRTVQDVKKDKEEEAPNPKVFPK